MPLVTLPSIWPRMRDKTGSISVALICSPSNSQISRADIERVMRPTLMGHDKDQHRSPLHRLANIRDSLDIIGQLDAGQVFPVLVLFVDDLGQLLALKLGT